MITHKAQPGMAQGCYPFSAELYILESYIGVRATNPQLHVMRAMILFLRIYFFRILAHFL
jgi:hypothetical protein